MREVEQEVEREELEAFHHRFQNLLLEVEREAEREVKLEELVASHHRCSFRPLNQLQEVGQEVMRVVKREVGREE